jgi:hypothetical protein
MDMQVPFNVRTARRVDPVIEARNREICTRYAAGETLAAIGSIFDISAERVRKILKKFGLDKSNGGLAARNLNKPSMQPVEPYCLRVYGCTTEELERFSSIERQAFLQQKTNVKRTGVTWGLTLPEWSNIWFRSAKWAQRGRGPFKHGLYRINSAGDFSVGNVLILKNSKSARRDLKAANQLPPLEFQREARVLARLESMWAENGPARRGFPTRTVHEAAHGKYWEHVTISDSDRVDGAEVHEK